MDIGATVVVRGRGLGTISAIRDGLIVVDELGVPVGESQFEVPADSDRLRPLVDRAAAERLIPLLGSKPARLAADDRAIAYHRALKRGDLAEQARLVAAMYSGPAETPERQYQERLENCVYGELAVALGVSRKALRAQIRAAATGERAPRSLALADRRAEVAAIALPPVHGLRPIGAFAIDTRIAVGEAKPDLTIDAEAGVWLAYAKPNDDDFSALVAVHRDAVAEVSALANQAFRVGRVAIEGAHIAIFDDAIADDSEVVQAMWDATFDIIEGRAAVIALGGDGVGTVHAAARRYVRVDL